MAKLSSVLGSGILLWIGVGVTATLNNLGFHWLTAQLAGAFFVCWWCIDQVDGKVLGAKFFESVALIFFRDIESNNIHHVPLDSPVVFAVAPHCNQFLDPLIIQHTCPRQVSFLCAAVTLRRKWVGKFAQLFNPIPVERPQDVARAGNGTVSVDPGDPVRLRGVATSFCSALGQRDQVALTSGPGTKFSAVVQKIISDTELVLRAPFSKRDASGSKSQLTSVNDASFKVLPHIDQKHMFAEVFERLNEGGCVGIFPEGGSHDRTKLLPLKAGVSIMALGAADKHPHLMAMPRHDELHNPIDEESSGLGGLHPMRNVSSTCSLEGLVAETERRKMGLSVDSDGADGTDGNGSAGADLRGPSRARGRHQPRGQHPIGVGLSIVPVGLTYSAPHRFRSRAFVDFGHPIPVTDELVERYREGGEGKIAACNELLAKVQRGIHGLTVQAPDHDTLKIFCMIRRLYKPTRRRLTIEQELEITRSFAEGYMRVQSHPRVQAVMEHVQEYCDALDSFSLDDYQVAQAQAPERLWDTAYTWTQLFGLFARLIALFFAFLPMGLATLPFLLISRWYSKKEATKAMRKSSVKIKGMDVIATWKVLISFVLLPLEHVVYTVFVYLIKPEFTAFYFFFSPFLFLLFIENIEQFRQLQNKTVPLITSLVFKERGNKLASMRRKLQKEVRSVALDLSWGSMGSSSTPASSDCAAKDSFLRRSSLENDFAERRAEKLALSAMSEEAEATFNTG